ncbi:MAG: GtrA family protein [Alphaproteobacteria bacterium]
MAITLFGYGVFSILVLAQLEPGIALAIATIAGVIFNYFTTYRLVFASSGIGRASAFRARSPWSGLPGSNLLALHRLTGAGLSPLLAQAIMLPSWSS